MGSGLLTQEETSLALEIIPENVQTGEELASPVAPSHGEGAAGGAGASLGGGSVQACLSAED